MTKILSAPESVARSPRPMQASCKRIPGMETPLDISKVLWGFPTLVAYGHHKSSPQQFPSEFAAIQRPRSATDTGIVQLGTRQCLPLTFMQVVQVWSSARWYLWIFVASQTSRTTSMLSKDDLTLKSYTITLPLIEEKAEPHDSTAKHSTDS